MKTRYMKNTLWASALFIASALTLVPSTWADTIAPGGSGSPDALLTGSGATLVGSTSGSTLFGGTYS